MAYFDLDFNILCDSEIKSPVMNPFRSVVNLGTVRPWSPLSPSNSNSRKVGQLDATIGTVWGEHSSLQLCKLVRKVSLRATGGDKAEIWQYFVIFECPMLNFQCERFPKLAGR